MGIFDTGNYDIHLVSAGTGEVRTFLDSDGPDDLILVAEPSSFLDLPMSLRA